MNYSEQFAKASLYGTKKVKNGGRTRRVGATIRKATFVTIGNSSRQEVPVEVPVANILLAIRSKRSVEDLRRGEMTSLREGFIYLVINPAWPQWIKAGMTIDYEDRLNSYNTSDPFRCFRMLEIEWSKDRRLAEVNLLKVLDDNAIARKGEWFQIDSKLAISILKNIE